MASRIIPPVEVRTMMARAKAPKPEALRRAGILGAVVADGPYKGKTVGEAFRDVLAIERMRRN